MEQDGKITPADNGAGNDTPKLFNVKVGIDANGEPIMQSLTEDELTNGYLRQSDYTRKTQELAEERKMLQANKQTPPASGAGDNDDAAVEKYLNEKGFVKQDTVSSLIDQKLQGVTKAQQDEQTIQNLLTSNPELKQFEGAIRKMASIENIAIEDIVVKYGFSNHDKLSKAKQRDIVGGGKKFDSDNPKPISEWTKEDWATFETKSKQSQFR